MSSIEEIINQTFVEILMNSEREQYTSETSEELRRESAREIVQEGLGHMNGFLHKIFEHLEMSLKYAKDHGKFPSKEEGESSGMNTYLEEVVKPLTDKFDQRYDMEKFEYQCLLKRLEMMM